MTSIRYRVFASILAVAAAMALWSILTGATPVQAKATTITTNINIPISLDVFVPCANGGAGEIVVLNGPLHVLFHSTLNDNRFRVKAHFQPQGVSGVGMSPGDKYQATGVTQSGFGGSFVNGQFTSTFVNNFRIIGKGKGNNLLIHMVFHITVNANGDVTTTVNNVKFDCK
ncbi:hypothetical protein IIA94_02560 [Patescibacteria group bacterium]|nr:hypothetical protein [Patescibacteria group bacterium]